MKLTTDTFSAEKVNETKTILGIFIFFDCLLITKKLMIVILFILFIMFLATQVAMATQQQRQTVTSSGRFNQERHAAASSQSKLTINAKSIRKDLSTVVSCAQVSRFFFLCPTSFFLEGNSDLVIKLLSSFLEL